MDTSISSDLPLLQCTDFFFMGEDLSSQVVRVSVLLLASDIEISVRSESSLLKSLGKGVIHGILHPRSGLCS